MKFCDFTEIDILEVEYANYEYTLQEIVPYTHEQEAKFVDKKIESEVLYLFHSVSYNYIFLISTDLVNCFEKSFQVQ